MPTRKPLAPVAAVPTGRTSLLAPTGPARLENARYLPVDDIRENPEQARQHFDEAALDELTDSVRQHGQVLDDVSYVSGPRLRPDEIVQILEPGYVRRREDGKQELIRSPKVLVAR